MLSSLLLSFLVYATPTAVISTLSLHDALPIYVISTNAAARRLLGYGTRGTLPPLSELFHDRTHRAVMREVLAGAIIENRELRSEEHTSELQSLTNLVCRLLLEKKNKKIHTTEQ